MVKSLYCLSLVVLTTMLCGSISAQTIYPLGQQNAGSGDGFQFGFNRSVSGEDRQSGWRFKVNVAGVVISRLGCNYPNGDVTVTLFEVAAPQAIIAQVTCPWGGGWQWTDLAAPVTLHKGSEYIIVGHSINGTRYKSGSRSQLASTWFPVGDIDYIERRYSLSTTTPNLFPGSATANMQAGVVDFGYTVNLGVATVGKLPDAGEGGAYDEYISAENGTPSYTWSLTSGALPNGLALVQNGDEFQLAGTPAAGTEGTYTFDVTVTDSATNTATATKTMELYVHDITIETPARLPDGIEGTAYLEDIQASYGTPPFTWSLTSGTLPSGLTLVQNGDNYRLAGTLAANSSDYYTFEVTVTDSATVPVTDTKTMTLLVVLPDGSYTYPMGRQDPTTSGFFPETVAYLQSGWKFKVNGGGVNLTKLGCNVPSGPVTVTLFDAATRAIMAQVICGPGTGWQFTNLTSPIALIPDKEYVIAGYTNESCYIGGTLPVAWTPTGVIEHKENLWTTAAPNADVFPPVNLNLPAWHLGLVDFGYTRDLSVSTPASLPNGAEQSFYSTNIQAGFGTPPYNWTHASGTLPNGLALAQASNEFQLSGTPASGAAGNYTFDVTVTDSATFPATSTKTVTVLIVPPPATLPFFDDFSTDKGWQYETSWMYGTEWTRGVTQGYTAPSPTRSEPTDDNTPSSTDNFIAGHKIGLDYEREMSSTVWLTSPPVDCTGVASVSLRYFRWMGVSIGDTALIEISGDGGVTWDEVWTSIPAVGAPQSNISDFSWLFVTHDISTWVANSASKIMQVRFGIGPTNGTAHTGWCLDDVHVVEAGSDFEVREGGLTGTLLTDNEAVGGLRDFGQIATGVQSTILTINMINNSANEFTGGTYTKSGDVSKFIVVKSPPFGLDSGTTDTMEIQFFSNTAGTFTATIEIEYTDGASTILFRINVTAEAVALVPVIQVDLATSGGLNIPHQDPATLANTRDFDTVNGGSSSVPIDIVITNTGAAPLDVIVDMGSVDWFHFTINGIPTNPTPSAITQTIPPQTNWSFSIAFEPNGNFPGQKDAYVRITHNDQAHPSYTGFYEVPVRGVCLTSAPLIEVSDGGLINHNDTAAGNRDFGDIVRNTTSAPLTITVSNSGGSDLALGVPTLATGAGEYSLDLTNFGTPAAAVSLAVNSSITFDIIFTPTSVGQKDATVSFTHNDTTVTSPFIINITGTGVLAAPVIEVSDGTTLLANPDTLDFGQQDVTAGPTAAVVITVENTGTAPLTLGSPTFNPVTSNFVLNTTGFPTSLAIGASATFSIQFDPAQEGSLAATIEFTHNDGSTATPFVLNLTGVGIAPVVEVREGSTTGVLVTSGDIAALGGGRDLGSIDVSAGATGPITISLKNTGSLNLDIYTIALAGTNAADFILNAPAGTTLTTGADTSFTITFDPTLGGIKDAQIVLAHNDPTNPSPFIIPIMGTAVDSNGVQIATTSLPAGNSDVAYMPTALTAIQGTAPYMWSVYSGNLPAGLTLSSEGLITGTPNTLVTTTYNFTVRVTDTTGATHEKQLSIIVAGSVIVPVGSPGASGCAATGGALALPLLLSLLLLAAYRRRRREEV